MSEPFVENQVADLSSLGTGTEIPAEMPGSTDVQEAKAFAEFIDSTLGFVAAVGLPEREFKIRAEEFKQTAQYLRMGENLSKVTSLQNVSPMQALIAGIVLFGGTVILTRPDLQAMIMSKLGKKKTTTETAVKKDNVKVSLPKEPEEVSETLTGQIG